MNKKRLQSSKGKELLSELYDHFSIHAEDVDGGQEGSELNKKSSDIMYVGSFSTRSRQPQRSQFPSKN